MVHKTKNGNSFQYSVFGKDLTQHRRDLMKRAKRIAQMCWARTGKSRMIVAEMSSSAVVTASVNIRWQGVPGAPGRRRIAAAHG
jgi:hypothetical protein